MTTKLNSDTQKRLVGDALALGDGELLYHSLQRAQTSIEADNSTSLALCCAALQLCASSDIGERVARAFGPSDAASSMFDASSKSHSSALLSMLETWNSTCEPSLRASEEESLPNSVRLAQERVMSHRAEAARLRAAASAARRLAAIKRAESLLLSPPGAGTMAADAEAVSAAAAVARGHATEGKLLLLRARTAADLYTPGAVHALGEASVELQESIEREERKQRELRRQLAEFDSCMPEIDRLAKEYARTRKRLDEKLWSLRELGAEGTEAETGHASKRDSVGRNIENDAY